MNINEFSNVFEKIGKEWMLVSASKDGKTNCMTASWGGLGVMWGKNAAFVFIRPQRYTKEFIDSSDYLSLSFFTEDYRKMLSFMGSKSGRDIDKIKEQNLHLIEGNVAPVYSEASVTLICKKMYRQSLNEDSFIDKTCVDKWYPNKDYHDMYVCEIIDIK